MALSNSNSELSPLFFSSAFEDEEDEEGEDEEDEAARFLSKTVFKTSSSSSPSSTIGRRTAALGLALQILVLVLEIG